MVKSTRKLRHAKNQSGQTFGSQIAILTSILLSGLGLKQPLSLHEADFSNRRIKFVTFRIEMDAIEERKVWSEKLITNVI